MAGGLWGSFSQERGEGGELLPLPALVGLDCDSGTVAGQPEDESKEEVHRAEQCKDESFSPGACFSCFVR